jgi:hypothetical protein
MIGLVVVAIGMSFGGIHGYAINPARDFGPRLFTVFAGFRNNGLTVNAWQGDAKTLLAYNLPLKKTENLAGFTIEYQVKGQPKRFLQNNLQFEFPGKHAQVATEPATSSVNAPIHKFRWLHVPGSLHQGLNPVMGPYTYTVTLGGDSTPLTSVAVGDDNNIDFYALGQRMLARCATRTVTFCVFDVLWLDGIDGASYLLAGMLGCAAVGCKNQPASAR